MQKFEDIVNDQYELFCHLVKKSNNLICYVGTGMSLYCKSWGGPFVYIAKKLYKLSDSNNDLSDYYRPIKQDMEKIIERMKSSNVYYPEIGDEIEEALDVLKQNKEGRNSSYNTYPESFDDWFIEYVKKCKDEYRYSEESKIQDAAFLIPYIGRGVCITTNCDTTLEEAYNRANILYSERFQLMNMKQWMKGGTDEIEEWEDMQRELFESKGIFYIHGHYKKKESLIMRKKSYDEVYNSGEESQIVRILKSIMQRKTILFLGAGLSKDQTLEVMKRSRIIGRNERYYHVAFFYSKEQETPTNEISTRKLILEHESYKIVLQQLIRETQPEYYTDCSWKQDFTVRKEMVENKEFRDKIEQFLNDDNGIFDVEKSYFVSQKEEMIDLLAKYYLYKTEDREGPMWTLCQIEGDKFELERSDSPLNNCPLGKTIYLIDTNKVTYSRAKEIIESIRIWTEQHKSDFDEKGVCDEEIDSFKIRVIVLNTENVDRILNCDICKREKMDLVEQLLIRVIAELTAEASINMRLDRREKLRTLLRYVWVLGMLTPDENIIVDLYDSLENDLVNSIEDSMNKSLRRHV